MDRSEQSITQTWMQEERSFSELRRALRSWDQTTLDDLIKGAKKHIEPAGLAAHVLPFEMMLVSMLIEEHKQVIKCREMMEILLQDPVKQRLP